MQELLEESDVSGISYHEKWIESDDDGSSIKNKGKQKKEKDPNAPKQPFSAFILFSTHRKNEMRDQNVSKQDPF